MSTKPFGRYLGFGLAVLMMLWIPATTPLHGQSVQNGTYLSPGQLDDLVAPIALYPDPLISQILVASTYPLELVEAHQWVLKNASLAAPALTQSAQSQGWDSSVQGLVAFPDVLNFLTDDIAWTTDLGNAFLAQESDVMDAVQRMRASAAQSGRLATNAQQQVSQVYEAGRPVYVIVPVNPDVIYVPVYDPFYIWGAPAYYRYPHWIYPSRTSVVVFGRGISLRASFGPSWGAYGWTGWNDWGWRPAWNTRTVVVNNTFVNRQFNPGNRSVRVGTTTWNHDASHRRGVPYTNPVVREHYQAPTNQRDRTVTTTQAPRPVERNQRPAAVNGFRNEQRPAQSAAPVVRDQRPAAVNGFRGEVHTRTNSSPVMAAPAHPQQERHFARQAPAAAPAQAPAPVQRQAAQPQAQTNREQPRTESHQQPAHEPRQADHAEKDRGRR